MEEAKTYYHLMKEFRNDVLNNKDQDIFIMNKNWLRKWKNYINYNHIKLTLRYNLNKNENKEKYLEEQYQPHPGCINNFPLLLPLSDYFNDRDRDNEDNVVINPEINIKQNMKLVGEKIWSFFFNKYGGGPGIKTRYIKKIGCTGEEVEIFKDKVKKKILF